MPAILLVFFNTMTLVSSIGEGRESFMPLVKDNLNSGLTLGLVRLIPIHSNILI
jgi:hypothetical protein